MKQSHCKHSGAQDASTRRAECDSLNNSIASLVKLWTQPIQVNGKICFIILATTPPLKVFRDFNWAKLPRIWKISSHNFDTALLIINLNRTNKYVDIFNDCIGFAWMWCSYVQILKSFALFVLEISPVKFIMVRIFRNSQ